MIFQEGNTYILEIPLTLGGDYININDISKVEFMFNNIRKTYGEDEDVTYDTNEKCFKVPLSQEETFSLQSNHTMRYQARVKFTDDSIMGTNIYKGYIQESLSKEVL